MTYYIDQVNYVRTHGAPSQAALDGVEVVYLQAERDEIVASTAAYAWRDAAGESFDVIQVNSKHVAYDADPVTWENVIRAQLNWFNRNMQ